MFYNNNKQRNSKQRIMSYNIPFKNPTKYKIQDKYMAQNKVPLLYKSGSASKTET